jgi:hypothetical protein
LWPVTTPHSVGSPMMASAAFGTRPGHVLDHRRRAGAADLLVPAEAELQGPVTPRRLASTAAQIASASNPFMSQVPRP